MLTSVPPGCVCRRPSEKRVCWACAFGTLSRPCPAALWPFLSPAPGEEGGFQQVSLCPLSPQGFVLAVTIIREAVEEIRCYLRDKEVNSQVYSRLTVRGQPGLPWGRLLPPGLGCRAAAQSSVADSQGAEFKAWGWQGCGRRVAGQPLSCWYQGGQPVPRGSGRCGLHPQVARPS